MSEPARTDSTLVDVRVGSTANALQPISSAERSLAAGSAQWLALIVVAAAAIVADQVTKQVVGRTLALGDSVDIIGPVSIHHVQNSGI
ncbi:MAG TPA: signal peptidase II, partial [Gaiellaceae bacterium]|nr:signal peptidase II [Gaiellaceae bacterium]